MALFAKNKPVKRVEFEGGWVELQHLSKGVKDEIKSRLSALFKGMDESTLRKLEDSRSQTAESVVDIPADAIDMVAKVQEVEYYKLTHAIKTWSESEVAVTTETVKELDEEIFDTLIKKVDEMNELSQAEEKN